MRIGIFQPDAAPSTPGQRLDRLDAALSVQEGFDLVVCPELFLSGFGDPDLVIQRSEPQDGPSSRAAAAIARKHDVALVYGYPEAAGGSPEGW